MTVFEKRVFRKIFGQKTDEVTADRSRLHKEDLHDLYSLPKFGSSNEEGCGERGIWQVWERGAHRVLVWKPDGKRPLERHRRQWGIILKWIFKK
jgi:hypothetical protein